MARPAYDAQERQIIEANICAKAVDLFALKGYRNVSLRAIARELGWSAPALYRYYDSKEALLNAIRAAGYIQIRQRLAEVRQQPISPDQIAAQAMRAYLDFALNQRELYQLMYELDQNEYGNTDEVFKTRQQAFAEAIAIAQDILDAGGSAGDANELAHLFWLSVHGLAALAVAHQLDLGKSCEQLINPVIQTLMRGIALEN